MKLVVPEIEDLFGDRLSYRERMAGGPPWLDHELLATDAARRRLVAWLDAGGLERSHTESDAARRARISLGFAVFGDDAMSSVLLDALLLTPPPVADVLAEEVCVLAVGWTVAGRTMGARLPRPGLIVLHGHGLDAPGLVRLALHEFAHSWLHLPRAGDIEAPAVTTAAQAEFRKLGAAEGWLEGVERGQRAKEREADALAGFWLRSAGIAS